MSISLSNRLSSLELAANQAYPSQRSYHILHPIINSDGSVHEVLETIIENGVAIRDDCGRPKWVSLAKADMQEHCSSDD